MIVRFGEFQFPLFKSRNQPDGLLKNDNLASLSLGELIQNCRQRLAIKTGETISEDQDLVLGFDQLGLILVEVRSHPSQYSHWTALTIRQDSRAALRPALMKSLTCTFNCTGMTTPKRYRLSR